VACFNGQANVMIRVYTQPELGSLWLQHRVVLVFACVLDLPKPV